MSGAKVSGAFIRRRCHRSNDRFWRSLSRLEVIQKSKPSITASVYVPFRSAAEISSRARTVNRVSLRRASKYGASKSSSRRCIARTLRMSRSCDIPSPRGEGTISRDWERSAYVRKFGVSTHLQYVSSRVILVGPTEGS